MEKVMTLVEHARRELERVETDQWFIDGMVKVVAAFAEMGHSGGSASIAIPMLNDLLQFKNLSPLTNDPDEWIDQTELTATPGVQLWQNKRNSEAFSNDGGKTYYLLSENHDRSFDKMIFHDSDDHVKKERSRV
jgi:hypothetical protein